MLTHQDILLQWPSQKTEETFMYYDQPLLYSCRFWDTHEHSHLVLVSLLDADYRRDDTYESWLALRLSPERLQQLKDDVLPLRDAFTQPEDEQLFLISERNGHPTQVQAISPAQLKDDELPDPGVMLGD